MKYIKIFILISVFLSAILFNPTYVLAMEQEAGPAATMSSFAPLLVDSRVKKLSAYLSSHKSPLTQYAHVFIREADKHNLDWKLVAAIAGTESTFGKRIPKGSYNAWGWGIPTGAQSGVGFRNWEHGIVTVSDGLRKNYVNKGAKSIDQIGRIYAASPAWPNHVKFFITAIDQFTPSDPEYLDVTI